MQSLRDKLLKAGLVSEEQAKKVEEDAAKRKERTGPRPGESAGAGFGGRPHHEARGRDDHRGGDHRGGESRGHERRSEHGANRPPPRRPDARPQGPAITVRRQPLSARAEAPIPKLPPLPGSKAAQRIESRKQLEQERKLRELVTTHQVPLEPGANTFFFVTRKNRLRRLELTEAQAKKLESGELAVVERPEPAQIEHSLVPPEIAEQMRALSEKSVRFLNKPGAQVGFLTEEDIRRREEQEKEAGPEAPQSEAERHEEQAQEDHAEALAAGTVSSEPVSEASSEPASDAPSPDQAAAADAPAQREPPSPS